jgi:hypothetical protein
MKKSIAELKQKAATSGAESLTAEELSDLKRVQKMALTPPAKKPTVREEFCCKCGIMIIAAHDNFTKNERGGYLCEWCEKEPQNG